jgi:hypothetical protein
VGGLVIAKKAGKADVALSFIQKLYGIESKLKDKTADEKHEIRQQQAKPAEVNRKN